MTELQAQWFEACLIENGPRVPIKLWFEDGLPRVLVAGIEVDPRLIDGKPAVKLTERKYDFSMKMLDWCRKHRPDHPKLHPFKPLPPRENQVQRWTRQRAKKKGKGTTP